MVMNIFFIIVRDHIPLEQGLRHNFVSPAGLSSFVRDHIPLEQGLRLEGLDRPVKPRLSETIFH